MMDELLGRAGAPTRAIMDSYQIIFPTYMLTDTKVNYLYDVVQPWEFPATVDKPSGPFTAVPDSSICGFVALPEGRFLVKAIPDGEPWLTNLYVAPSRMNNTFEDVVQVSPLGQDLFALRDVVYGRHRCLYLYDQEMGLMCYSLDEQQVTHQVPSIGQLDSLAYIDAWDTLIAFKVGIDTFFKYDRNLNLIGKFSTPCCHSVEHESQMEPDPSVPGRVWIWRAGATELYRLDIPEAGSPTMELVGHFDKPIDAMAVGEHGLLVASMGGSTWQFDVSDGNLNPNPGDFEGHPSGSVLMISKSSNNYDHAIHGDIQNDVFLGTSEVPSVPDCLGDFDGDDTVGIGDLLMLLEAWGGSDPYMDIAPGGGDETVSTPDLLELLAAWGPCP